MLSEEQIENNKKEFIDILRSITIEGVDVEPLIAYLEASDFFTAPASTKYHAAYEGGLCEHSLSVYYTMQRMIEEFAGENQEKLDKLLEDDSVKIVALLHDVSKIGLYTITSRNEKVYSPDGTKYDALGTYNWVTTTGYTVKQADERFVCVDHDVNSAYIVNRFLPLTTEQFAAIANHSGGMTNKFSNNDLNEIFKRFPLALFLHLADMTSSYYKNI